MPCGTRQWIMQAYPSETGRTGDTDSNNLYGCNYTMANPGIILIEAGGIAAVPVSNISIMNDQLNGSSCTTPAGVVFNSVSSNSPITGIKIADNLGTNLVYGIDNVSSGGGRPAAISHREISGMHQPGSLSILRISLLSAISMTRIILPRFPLPLVA